MDDLPRLSLSLYLSVRSFKQCLLRNKVLNTCRQASCWVAYTHSLPLDLGWSAVRSWPSWGLLPTLHWHTSPWGRSMGPFSGPASLTLGLLGPASHSPGTLLPLSCPLPANSPGTWASLVPFQVSNRTPILPANVQNYGLNIIGEPFLQAETSNWG